MLTPLSIFKTCNIYFDIDIIVMTFLSFRNFI